MDLGRTDPGLCKRGEVVCRPFELAGRMVYPELGLGEQNTGRDDAGQEGEDQGGIGTNGGAHLGTQRSGERARESLKSP